MSADARNLPSRLRGIRGECPGDGLPPADLRGILPYDLSATSRASMSKTASRTAELVRVAQFRAELRRFLARTEAASREAGLSPQRYDLLLMVEAAGVSGVRVTDLCEILQMKQTTVTELVKRAVESKLIERSNSPDDRRSRVLKLTTTGRRQLFKVYEALRDDRAALTETFEELGVRFHASST